MNILKKELKCSFCKKSQNEVSKLIAGPDVYICDECVKLCIKILLEEGYEFNINNITTPYTEESWKKDFDIWESDGIYGFIERNIYLYTEKTNKLLSELEKLDLKNKYKYEYNVLKEALEFYVANEPETAIEFFKNAIKENPNQILSYLLFIDSNWENSNLKRDKSKLKKVIADKISYCEFLKKIAVEINNPELRGAINIRISRLSEIHELYDNIELKDYNETNKEKSPSFDNISNYQNNKSLNLIMEEILVRYGKKMHIEDLENELNQRGINAGIVEIQMEIYANSHKFSRDYDTDIVYLNF